MIYRSAFPGGPKGRKLRSKLQKMILDGRKQTNVAKNDEKSAVTKPTFVPGQGRREVILQRLAKLKELQAVANMK